MNILFLSLARVDSISDRGIYNDLMRKFLENGHQVTIVCPTERRYKEASRVVRETNVTILKVKTLNIQKTNVIEKGISTLLLEYLYLKAIKSNLSLEKFDLILYSTPPITLTKVIGYCKKKYNAKTYLLLKDIFPQNAVDLGMIKKNGFIHSLFLKREKLLYKISDYIGCMSPANVRYILKSNPEISAEKVEVNPNSLTLSLQELTQGEKLEVKKKYSIPLNSKVFIYGGNLGKPQGLDFLLTTLEAFASDTRLYFLIIGSGTEYGKVKAWFNSVKPMNAKLMTSLNKPDYDLLVQSCDVGMLFLDKRFTIPNFPSRLLSYMEAKMPIVAAVDTNTDIGTIIEDNQFGMWCENGDLDTFRAIIERFVNNSALINVYGVNGYNYLLENYLTDHSYKIITSHFEHV
jgi:glycosyltransferase involved in cell wall biosynthesis